jgi:molybdenum cofactor cytidylyltransferase
MAMTKDAPRIAGILLAAGSSRRFGADNKLLADVGGVPLVRHSAEALCASRVSDVIVVTGPDRDRIEQVLSGLDVRFVHNSAFADGIGGSIATGVATQPPGHRGVAVVQGDMPALTSGLIDRLLDAFLAGGGDRVAFPVIAGGSQRNPVVWPASAFAELRELVGDKGAKPLIEARRANAITVPIAQSDVFTDIDTQDELHAWRKRTDR